MKPQRRSERSTNNRKRPATGRWVLPLALIFGAGGGALWQARPDAPADDKQQGEKTVAAVRTARTSSGPLERTIRLTGTTAPERYASLLAPQMRGSRGGGGMGGALVSGGGMRASVGGGGGGGGGGARGGAGGGGGGGGGGDRSGGSGGSGGSSSSSSSSSSGDTGSSSAGSSSGSGGGGGGTTGGSGSLQTALNRFSSPTSSVSSRSASRVQSIATSPGSASGGSGGGGGGGMGGPGGGDFQLVLQNCAPAGSRVSKGQVVAEFDRESMLTRLDNYRANTDQADAAMKALQANLEVEKKTHQQSIDIARARLDQARLDLKTIPVKSANDTERLKLNVEEAEANFKQLQSEVKSLDLSHTSERRIAELEVNQSKVELKRAEANADRMIFKAPMDGLIVMGTTLRGSEIGQIRAGDPVNPGMMFMRIVDPSSMVVNASVNQVDVEMIRVGQKAKVHFDAYPNLELPARIHSIGAVTRTGGFRASFFREIPVTLKLDKIDPRVVPDLSVSADVILESEQNVTLAPLESVFRDNAGKPFVFVRGRSGWERRPVEIGLTSNVAAVIRSGLQPGEVLALEWPLEKRN